LNQERRRHARELQQQREGFEQQIARLQSERGWIVKARDWLRRQREQRGSARGPN